MRLVSRHMGRRVAGVGVGVALLVLGLEAPAFAVTPTITGFAPTSGTDGCVVAITGTSFTNPPVVGAAGVTFNGVNAADYKVKSDTEIWATAPASVASGVIEVTNGSGTATSSTAWIAGVPGGCSPTADSFSPTCGPVGTPVTITGTNLMKSSTAGADVYFGDYLTTDPNSGVPAAAPTDQSLTSLTAVVPALAADGPIAVVTYGDGTAASVGAGADFSGTTFSVGACVTDMTPTAGDVGTTVTITGVGFDNVTAVAFTGASSTTVPATWTLTSDTDTTDIITTTVPFGAVKGPITLSTVDAPDGVSIQTADFTVGAVTHPRNITLKLAKHLVAKGKVTVPDGFSACASGVPVKIQRRASGHWKTVGKTTTSATGVYKKRIRDRHGKYRSKAPQVTASGETCLVATSRKVRH
jgi:hypothetical protein